jgi:hypothetical protein
MNSKNTIFGINHVSVVAMTRAKALSQKKGIKLVGNAETM